MTAEQFDAIMAILGNLRFLAQAGLIVAGLVGGAVTWRLIILAKNQRNLW